ncbi:MAG TPA: alpha/beta fold hydrolase [Casimicrobiaceae bacterium]|nr:alpha/beta fold hydrolase [Casimicrobiaceae bacterium]
MIAYPIAAGKILTRVLEAGKPGAPAILLMHGLSSRADRWVRNIDGLAAAGFHVFAADLPGHGFAAKNPADDHTIGGYAKFVLDLMDALEIRRTTIVGTSLGGQVVATAALRAPERIERMMMIGSTGFAPSTPERAQGFRDWIMNLTPETHRPKLERVFTDKSLVTDEMVLEDIRINTSPGASACFDKFLTYMAYQMNQDLVGDRLHAIADRVPLLLFWGIDDTSVSVEIGRAARAKLAKSRLITVEHLNHTPYYENPPLLNEVLLRFISGTLDGVAAPRLTLV